MNKNWNIEPLLQEAQLQQEIKESLHQENLLGVRKAMINQMIAFTGGHR